ncbi:ABC transporter substrate-binding protein [Mesorhizobium sp. 8]|uniref:ABC transporter substrate-binding protein n=1 Tax=Mesorhizobium sp. 8 TaxID=2584466 RepID=UPI0015D6701D|nr:ABC transporter substrate-binding protein [Mesorhizobium sp. 8]
MTKSAFFKVVVAVCLAAVFAMPVQAADKVKVAITTFGWSYVPILTAAQLGLYEKEGLDVEIINTGGGAKAAAALAGGSVDIFGTDAGFILKARERGADMKLFGASMTEYATNLVISKAWAEKAGVSDKSSYEQKLQALKGVTIGVLSRGSGHEQLVRFLAREAKIDADKEMTITAMGTSDATLAAFMQGRIDAFVHSAPIGERAVKDYDGFMLFNMSKGEVKPLKGFLYTAYVSREEWLKSNPDVAVRFLRAQQRALNVLHDPEQTIKARDAVHAAYFSKLDPALWTYVWDNSIGAFPATVEVNAGQMKQAADLVNAFQPEPLPSAVVDASWTDDFAKQAAGLREMQ